MWSTALSVVTSLIGTSWFKPLAIALGCIVSAWLGYSYSAHSYEAQIASIRSEMASATAQMEKENAQRLANAYQEKETANARIDALARSNSDLLARVRKYSSGSGTAKAGSSADNDRESLARCRSLLLRGAELAQRGCEQFGKCAANHDALIELVK